MSGVIIDANGNFQVDPKLLVGDTCTFCKSHIDVFDMKGVCGVHIFCAFKDPDCYTEWLKKQKPVPELSGKCPPDAAAATPRQ